VLLPLQRRQDELQEEQVKLELSEYVEFGQLVLFTQEKVNES
jgi:hypothetical protein